MVLMACFANGSSGPVLNLNNITVNDSASPSYAGFRINRNGTIEARDNAGYYQVSATTDWVDQASRTTTIGDSYEFKTVKTSGTSLTGHTDNMWYTIDGAPNEGYITTNSFPKSYRGTLYVREIADTANQVSCTLSFDVAAF